MDTKYKANQELNPLSTYPVWSSLFEQISPRSNTGEKSQVSARANLQKAYKDYPLQHTVMVLTEDGPKPVLIRRPAHFLNGVCRHELRTDGCWKRPDFLNGVCRHELIG